jgi:hypothetical protein
VGDGQRDGNRDGERTSAFDPVAGVRALADVQRRGLLAATELVDRLVDAVDGAPDDGDGAERAVRHDGPDTREAAPGSIDELVELWLQLVRLGADVIAQVAAPSRPTHTNPPAAHAARDQRPSIDVVAQAGTGLVSVTASRGAEVWLDNTGADDRQGLRLRAGGLLSHEGAALPSGSLRFEPAVVDLPGRSSRGVAVSAVPGDAPPGTYRGVIVAQGAPDAWLPVEVVVGGPDQG